MAAVDYLEKISAQIGEEIAKQEGLEILDQEEYIKDIKNALIIAVRSRILIGALQASKVLKEPDA